MAEKKQAKKKSPVNAEKIKNLKLAMDKIDKDFGKGTIMVLGEQPSVDVDAVKTGSVGLDIALGIGGLPRGRIVEIFGPESAGKNNGKLHKAESLQSLPLAIPHPPPNPPPELL